MDVDMVLSWLLGIRKGHGGDMGCGGGLDRGGSDGVGAWGLLCSVGRKGRGKAVAGQEGRHGGATSARGRGTTRDAGRGLQGCALVTPERRWRVAGCKWSVIGIGSMTEEDLMVGVRLHG